MNSGIFLQIYDAQPMMRVITEMQCNLLYSSRTRRWLLLSLRPMAGIGDLLRVERAQHAHTRGLPFVVVAAGLKHEEG